MDEIGVRLRQERVRLCYTQKQLAAAAGLLANAQLNYERGLRSPSASYLAQVALIGVDVLYVVTGERSTRFADDGFGRAFESLPATEQKIIADLVDCIARRP